MLEELLLREKQKGIKPDPPEIDAFMKATAIAGQKTNFQTDYVLKVCNFCSVNFILITIILLPRLLNMFFIFENMMIYIF